MSVGISNEGFVSEDDDAPPDTHADGADHDIPDHAAHDTPHAKDNNNLPKLNQDFSSTGAIPKRRLET